MFMKSLLELYLQHDGKVSDKWTLYLTEYDRLFNRYRHDPVSLLEIGVQNGGSLEIWGKYFLNAERLIGCDINIRCAQLSFSNERIQVVVGDANTDSTHTQIKSLSPSFDIIIDDGSHTSSDITKSFARYFPSVKAGGLFIAEDIHCSYWQEYEGGLFYPHSSISLFKRLADIINHEHWGVEKKRAQVLTGFGKKHNIEFDEEVLQSIHSVEFVNSMCVVRKQPAAENTLGTRLIAGHDEAVVQGHLPLAGTTPIGFSQANNPWSTMALSPDEDWSQKAMELSEQETRIALHQRTVDDQIRVIEQLKQHVAAMENSWSWKITAPLRTIIRTIFR